MNENDDCMSIEQFGILRSLVVNQVDEYFVKIAFDETRRGAVSSFLAATYATMSPSTTLLPEVLSKLTSEVYGDVYVRDAVLNLTSSLTVMLSLRDFTFAALVNTLKRGICLAGNTSEKSCVIPDGIKQGLAIPQENDYVEMILTANPWIVTVILVQLFYQYTESFKSMFNETASH
jgi:hypothetical protein